MLSESNISARATEGAQASQSQLEGARAVPIWEIPRLEAQRLRDQMNLGATFMPQLVETPQNSLYLAANVARQHQRTRRQIGRLFI